MSNNGSVRGEFGLCKCDLSDVFNNPVGKRSELSVCSEVGNVQ